MKIGYRRFQSWLYTLLIISGRYNCADVAARIGCDENSLYRWCAGTGGYFPIDLLANLQRVLTEVDRAELERLFLSAATPPPPQEGRWPLDDTLDVVRAAHALLESVRSAKGGSALAYRNALRALDHVQIELDEARDTLTDHHNRKQNLTTSEKGEQS